ncbi:peptide MFS transporter [Flavobacterium granuli]|uniref:POT family proton-dependent oligopeptide transporter n=1 Tax=Flavobacterium granuli TaxID=280093 RepID=A0A1M5PLM7_9FLAO|nr:peptide MFS transporter [Flavobacterium granuli]PRZ26518.1 POT family proton-dependent oligopeptide transporter [Flavobacterium granuli]SHH02153.1 proton-dependent oligopeptide transporter, POT family [Flavobacterium granuli]
MSKTSVVDYSKSNLFGHPTGLFILFLTEMWERFSYYGMRALLVLYMTTETLGDVRGPGLGWTSQEALALYGWYTMLVYVMSIPGGMIADKLVGQKKAVLLGAIILCLGHGVLVLTDTWAFYTGLGLVILGVGLLKPNISTMVGGLYPQGDIRRDKGFSIFYIGINTGSLLATMVIGFVVAQWGWHAGFGLAGIAMVLGLVVYLWGQKYLTHVGNFEVKQANTVDESSYGHLFKNLLKSQNQLLFTVILSGLSIYGWYTLGWGFGLLFFFLTIITALMMMIYKELTSQQDKDRFMVLLLSFIMVIIFWGAFEQAGGLMNLYTDTKTDRMLLGWEVPTVMFQSLNAGFIILFATVVAGYWAKRKLKGSEASSLFKMATGIIIMGFGFLFMVFAAMEFEKSGTSSMIWLVLAYLFHTIGELCLSPVALSFITKLSPVKYASLMMGVYFAATGLGNKVAGIVGESASNLGEYSVFLGILVFTIIIGSLFIMLLKPLKRLTHGAEDNEK